VNISGLDEKAQETWKKLSDAMETNLKAMTDSREIGAMRKAFDPVSEAFAKVIMGFRHTMKDPLLLYHCPMASNEQGAYWIESSQDVKNPYFGGTPYKGQEMLKCAELVEKIPPEAFPSLDKAKDAQESDAKQDKEKPDGSPKSAEDKHDSGAEPDQQEAGSHPSHDGGKK